MKVLALDLGTTTGWAVGEKMAAYQVGEAEVRGVDIGGLGEGVVTRAGCWDLKPHRHQSEAMRYVLFRGRLMAILGQEDVEVVVFEDVPFRAKSTRAGQVWGGLAAVAMEFAESRGLLWIGIPPAAIKRKACGKGAARKEVMMELAEKRWPKIKLIDDNQADAMWLAQLYMEDYDA